MNERENDIPRIGPKIILSDDQIERFLKDQCNEHYKLLQEKMGELNDTIEETEKEEQPMEFAYAKLLNYLNAQDTPTIIYLCAAAMWELLWNTNPNE
jgi:hypothetical protein